MLKQIRTADATLAFYGPRSLEPSYLNYDNHDRDRSDYLIVEDA
jgi:hypothetical protein